mgnify:CR=1 FL=1
MRGKLSKWTPEHFQSYLYQIRIRKKNDGNVPAALRSMRAALIQIEFYA